jgi:intein/homing endonuclease/8-oxo-dGTP pyrophosphatase MutT (NUDIX family)
MAITISEDPYVPPTQTQPPPVQFPGGTIILPPPTTPPSTTTQTTTPSAPTTPTSSGTQGGHEVTLDEPASPPNPTTQEPIPNNPYLEGGAILPENVNAPTVTSPYKVDNGIYTLTENGTSKTVDIDNEITNLKFQLNVDRSQFEAKYTPLIVGGKFVGTQEQYDQYLKELGDLTKLVDKYNSTITAKEVSQVLSQQEYDSLLNKFQPYVDKGSTVDASTDPYAALDLAQNGYQKNYNTRLVINGLENKDINESDVVKFFGQDYLDALNKFKANNHLLSDGKGIPNEQWDRLDPYYQKIADANGLDAMVVAISTRYNQNDTAYNDAISNIQKAGAMTPEGNIDVAEYLRKNPTDTATIYSALGTDDPQKTKQIIDDAQKYNERPIALNDYRETYFKDKDWTQVLPDKNDPLYPEKMKEFDSHIAEMTADYKAKYGSGAFYGSIAATPLSFVFSPARALAPDVTVKDISGMEWAVGGAQIATLAVPIVGSLGRVGAVSGMGITGASTGLFATDIALRRAEMSKAMMGLSIAGLVLPFVPEVRSVGKGIINRARPSVFTGESIGLTADVGRVQIPEGMSPLAARQLIEDVELLNLKGTIPSNELRGLRGTTADRISITRTANGVADVKILSADGNVIGHVSGSQRVMADTLYHATPDTDGILKQIQDKGYFEVEAGAGEKPVLFTSPQGAQTFAYNADVVKSPGFVAIKVLPDDIKPLPIEVRDSRTIGEMRDKLHAMAKSGEIDPGIYPLYKGYRERLYDKEGKFIGFSKQSTMEYELVATPGTKFYPADAKWYAKGEVPKTGVTSLLNYTGKGVQVKTGDVLPMYWVTTDAAKMAGKGVPSLQQIYGAKIAGDLTTIRQYAPWNLRIRKDIPTTDVKVSAGSPLASSFQQLKLVATPTDWSAGRMTGLIKNADGDVLLVRQLGQERYDLPGGGAVRKWIKNDSPETTMQRELYEEVGIKPDYISHTDSFDGKFNPADKNTRQFHIFEGVTKETPNPGAEIADYVWWDGKSDLKYPVADFAKDALNRSATNAQKIDDIVTSTILQNATIKAKTRLTKMIQDERGSVGYVDAEADPRYQSILKEELESTSNAISKEAQLDIKTAYDEGYLPYRYDAKTKTVVGLPTMDGYSDVSSQTYESVSPKLESTDYQSTGLKLEPKPLLSSPEETPLIDKSTYDKVYYNPEPEVVKPTPETKLTGEPPNNDIVEPTVGEKPPTEPPIKPPPNSEEPVIPPEEPPPPSSEYPPQGDEPPYPPIETPPVFPSEGGTKPIIPLKNKEHQEVVENPPPGTICFPKGTKVIVGKPYSANSHYTNEYKSTHFAKKNKSIEDVKIGDLVLTFNELTCEKEFKKVVNVSVRETRTLIIIKFSNGNLLRCTPEHPIAIASKGKIIWKSAKTLSNEDEVIQYKYSGLNIRLLALDGDRQRNIAEKTINDRKGKTLEQIFGDTVASKIKDGISAVNTGKPSPQKGKTIDEYYGIGKATEIRNKESCKSKGNTSKKGWLASGKTKKLISIHHADMKGENNPFYGKTHTEEVKRKTSERNIRMFEQDPTRAIRLVTFSQDKANTYETKLSYILRSCVPHEYKYNGNGNLGITFGRKVPDFWNVNGKKKVIEFFGETWHEYKEEQERRDLFKKYGVDCLVIWGRDFRNIKLLKEKIKTFTYNPNVELIKVVSKETYKTKLTKVYNLEVADNNNYFAYGILVHNCWIQGRPMDKGGTYSPMYKVVYPPYSEENMFTTRQNPSGYEDDGFEGKGSAFKSIKVVGGAMSNSAHDINLGFTKLNIDIVNGQPELSFAQNDEANSGARENTIGMGEGQIPIETWKAAKAQGMTKAELITELNGENPTQEVLPQIQEVETDVNPEYVKSQEAIARAMQLNNEPLNKKKPKVKDWWTDPMYDNPSDTYSSRYYRGRRLLPPNIGGKL